MDKNDLFHIAFKSAWIFYIVAGLLFIFVSAIYAIWVPGHGGQIAMTDAIVVIGGLIFTGIAIGVLDL